MEEEEFEEEEEEEPVEDDSQPELLGHFLVLSWSLCFLSSLQYV